MCCSRSARGACVKAEREGARSRTEAPAARVGVEEEAAALRSACSGKEEASGA